MPYPPHTLYPLQISTYLSKAKEEIITAPDIRNTVFVIGNTCDSDPSKAVFVTNGGSISLSYFTIMINNNAYVPYFLNTFIENSVTRTNGNILLTIMIITRGISVIHQIYHIQFGPNL